MARLVWIVLVCAVVYWLARRRVHAVSPEDSDRPVRRGKTAMLKCAHCGIHFPENEAASGRDGRDYCSSSHAMAAFNAGD